MIKNYRTSLEEGGTLLTKTLEPSPMEDLETLATPASASDSTKKKKRKKHSKKSKPIDVTVDASEPIDAAVDAAELTAVNVDAAEPTAVTVDAPEPTDVTIDVPEPTDVTIDVPEPMDVTVDAPKPIEVTVDASLIGGSSSAAVVVGYFPTGYDPLAAAAAGDESAPRTRLFRHEKHPTWVDLVVGSPGGGPDFVGRSYAGEAAAPQLCEYALGVLDKASGILRVVPIAAKKVLRLEPYLEVQRPAHSQHSELASEAGSAAGNEELRVQDLTMAYGTKMDRDKDNKWRSLNEQRNDPSAYDDNDIEILKANVSTNDSQEPVIARNIPPYNPTADTSEKVYLLDEIIPKNMRQHLLEIVNHLESREISSKGYGSFVSNRVQKLQELQGEDKERLAWILSYIQHLLSLFARNGFMSNRQRKDRKENLTNCGPTTPQAVYRRLLLMFTESGGSTMSTEKKDLLINYILVLTLFADDFKSDPTDICADLKMTRQMIKPYYDQLGCKSLSAGAFKSTFMTLPAPLKFPQEVTRKKRRRR
ncbi:hypothetical protein U9M48_001668 [Paspalum notatum var. saurae]|uniref:DNA-directed RNA polymerase I subunit rpa49 n=1 Tax=Paspalum notatum var. saurae TaxID=547442 RepID=A0AAQ3SIH5_PASNO